ncbi:DUF2764 family protein [Maribellus maritimus]|uniref:DUF2764 family protein n=1 Tax=Maribellus maritimus TaxID=2870838 RepID=UPI001EEBECB2|nr:DUF2764 family protein [Maribellus maritimus]MCG6186795.1 DUF2764 domain-containing protein [Maribellus maritimus]
MFKKNYYCLIAGLPDLFFNELKSEITPVSFRRILKNDLIPADFEFVRMLFYPDDNNNLLNQIFDSGATFNCSGNFAKKFLDEQIENPTEIPEYMIQFLKWIKNKDIKQHHLLAENKLHTLFYEYAAKIKNRFLRDWFLFDLKINNLITAFHCLTYKYEISEHLIHTEETNVMNSLLLGNQLKPEYFDDEIPFASEIIRVIETDMEMNEKEKNIDKIKWNYLDEQTFFDYFTIEKILSYTIKLKMIERWTKLDKKTGKELLEKLLTELKTSYVFPEEFSVPK